MLQYKQTRIIKNGPTGNIAEILGKFKDRQVDMSNLSNA